MVCQNCGCSEIIETTMKDVKLKPVNNIYCSGSPVLLNVCSQCGLVLSIKAEKPEKLKK